jgi:predicted TIM-barrel fold metal-dependent hydrolase
VGSDPSQPVVDVWANYWPRQLFTAYPPLQELYDRIGLTWRSKLDDGHLLVEMDAAGVDRAVVSAAAVDGWPDANEATLALCRQAPERLLPCASVDPWRGVAALRQLRRAVEAGAIALKLLPFPLRSATRRPGLLPAVRRLRRGGHPGAGPDRSQGGPGPQRARHTYGRHKVLFGSGYPMIALDTLVGDVDELSLCPESRHWFLGGNASTFWGWP